MKAEADDGVAPGVAVLAAEGPPTPTFNKSVPSQILPWLYLGSKYHYFDRVTLAELGITAVLNVVGGRYPSDIPSDRFEIVPMSDYGTDKLEKKLVPCLSFLQRMKEQGEKVLVHCQVGVNRSPTVVLAYLMRYENMSLAEAASLVQERRPIVYPHKLYLQQLRELEVQWRGESTFSTEVEDKLFPPIVWDK